jgi:hypothetical protein
MRTYATASGIDIARSRSIQLAMSSGEISSMSERANCSSSGVSCAMTWRSRTSIAASMPGTGPLGIDASPPAGAGSLGPGPGVAASVLGLWP